MSTHAIPGGAHGRLPHTLPVSEANRQCIEACGDADQLDHWLVRAATVVSVDDIFEG